MSGRFMAEAAEQASADLSEACDGAAQTISRKLIAEAADREETSLGNTLETEAQNAQSMSSTLSELDGSADSAADGINPEPEGPPAPTPVGTPAGPIEDQGPDVPQAGVDSGGTGSAETGHTDPVDVVSGQLLIAQVDLSLPGVLPLVLRRAYASGYEHGGLHGPGWSSTLDVRLVVDDGAISFLGDDCQRLEYGVPAGLGLGLPSFPTYGARWTLSAERGAHEYRVQDPSSGVTWCFPMTDEMTAVLPLAAIVDRNGNRIRVERDQDGVPVRVVHDGGYGVEVETIRIAETSRISTLRLAGTDGADAVTVVGFQYDEAGRLCRITDSSGVPYVYEWNESSRICGWIDRSGYAFRYAYDAAGRVVHTEGDGGYLTADLAYDVACRTTTVTDSLGHTTTYHYDRFQHLTRIVDRLGEQILLVHDRYGRLVAHTDQLGHTTRITRDRDGNAQRLDRPDGTTVLTRFHAEGRPSEIVDASGGRWRYTYDERGNLVSVTDPLGEVQSYSYDERGGLTGITDACGATTRYELDGAGLPVAEIDPLGAVTRTQRDRFGRVTEVTDPLGATTRVGCTIEGRRLWRKNPDGSHDRWEYDPAWNLIRHEDAAGAVTSFTYGPFGRVRARTDPSGATYSFTHDTELRLTEVTGPTGLTWRYEFDPAGNLVAEVDFNGRRQTYASDAAGRLIRRVNGAGQITEYLRDSLGRVLEKRAEANVYRYTYDAAGRMARAQGPEVTVEYTRDALGRPIHESVNGHLLTREYDAAGRTVTRTTPAGATSRWTYDAAGLPTSLTTATGRLEFAYDPTGREIRRGLGPQVELSRSFDMAGRLTEQRVTAAGTVLAQRAYAYRADGTPDSISDLAFKTRVLALDAVGRVTAVQAEDWHEGFAYDSLGNISRAEAADSGTGEAIHDTLGDREYSGTVLRRAGQISYEYDTHGRLIRQSKRTLSGQRRIWLFTWDADDRLVSVTVPDGTLWQYTYDPFGRRCGKMHLGPDGSVHEAHWFTWDATRIAEQTDLGAAERHTAVTWDYQPGTQRALTQSRFSWADSAPQEQIDSEFYAIVTDLVGTPTEMVTADGRVAWRQHTRMWGERISDGHDADLPLRFPGQYYDSETGLHYNYFRYYDPATGRYLSPDPLGLQAAPNDYAYPANPLTWCDPLGLAGLRGPDGRFARDPSAPPILHNRDTEYPGGYRQSTHDEMVRRWTDEGLNLPPGQDVPRDAAGNRIPRDQLTWRDPQGNLIDPENLTYEHLDPVVDHWNGTGYNSARSVRNDFYNDPDNMVPMTRSENSSGGGQMTQRYRQDVGPNYSCGG